MYKDQKRKIVVMGNATIAELKKTLINDHNLEEAELKKIEYEFEHLAGAKRYNAIIQKFSYMIHFLNKIQENLKLKTIPEEMIVAGGEIKND